MRRILVLLAGATVLGSGCASNREPKENEVEVTFDQLPPAVRETFTRESGGAPIGKIERENEKGKTVYEATIARAGKTWEIEVDESGNVLQREEAGDDKED
jgi:uncharacterized membrane protein YkoI